VTSQSLETVFRNRFCGLSANANKSVKIRGQILIKQKAKRNVGHANDQFKLQSEQFFHGYELSDQLLESMFDWH